MSWLNGWVAWPGQWRAEHSRYKNAYLSFLHSKLSIGAYRSLELEVVNRPKQKANPLHRWWTQGALLVVYKSPQTLPTFLLHMRTAGLVHAACASWCLLASILPLPRMMCSYDSANETGNGGNAQVLPSLTAELWLHLVPSMFAQLYNYMCSPYFKTSFTMLHSWSSTESLHLFFTSFIKQTDVKQRQYRACVEFLGFSRVETLYTDWNPWQVVQEHFHLFVNNVVYM